MRSAYIAQILGAVMMASFMSIMIPRAAVSAGRITEVLSTESSVVAPLAPVTTLRASGLVEFRNVSFAYPGADAPVLRNLDFTAKAGTTTAIIGSTGAGKTTLVNLLPRLFDATDGECSSMASTCATSIPTCCGAASASCRRRRTSSPEPSRPTCATAIRLRPTTTSGKRSTSPRPGTSSRSCQKARGIRLAGRHELLRRPEAANRDRAGTGQEIGDPGLRRFVFRPRYRHGCGLRASLTRNAREATRDRGRAAGLHDHRRRPDPGARPRRDRRAGNPRELLVRARPTPRSWTAS